MEIVDRSRVADPPALVGPADWHAAADDNTRRGPVTMRIAGHTLGTPEQTVPEALALFAAAGLDAAELIYQDGYRSGLPLRRPALRRAGPAGVRGPGSPDRRDDPVHDGDQRARRGTSGGPRSTSSAARSRSRRSWAPTGSASTRGRGNQASSDHAAHWHQLVAALRTLAPEAVGRRDTPVRREPLRHHDPDQRPRRHGWCVRSTTPRYGSSTTRPT